MNRNPRKRACCLLVFAIFVFGSYTVSAQTENVPNEQEVPENIRANNFYNEYQRLTELVQEAYNNGDYDAAEEYAREAARYKQLSDDFIAWEMNKKTPLPEPDNFLPAAYTVRPWNVSKDCFWNIAGRPWVYGDPHKWRLLYNANKMKLPDPNNPNVIEPGIVLDIPSIKGETRQGEWENGKTYEPLQ